jgi:predicted enzyme related to lactoylglutathione lyase
MPRPIHFEIHADDLPRAQAFYAALFGWSFVEYMPGFYYQVITGPDSEPGINGGMVKRRGGAGDKVIAYVCVVGVPDIDAAIAKFTDLGGEVALPKHPVPKIGWNFYGKDTEGNVFGIFEADPAAA